MNIEQHVATLDEDLKQVARGELTTQQLHQKYLSRSGLIKSLYGELKALSPDVKRQAGEQINQLRQRVEAICKPAVDADGSASSKGTATTSNTQTASQASTGATGATTTHTSHKNAASPLAIDLSRQPYPLEQGSLHPVNLILSKVIEIFDGLGFDIVDDDEVDSEENCFDKLRIPSWHPARDTQDTFYLEGFDHTLLRTHSTATQPKILATCEPPLKVVSIGKVFRSDELDATHTPMFHQVDGFMVGPDITLAHLKGVLEVFIREFIPNAGAIRFRPHYFSYTEPSLELDLQCDPCNGKGCKACKHQGWIELLGGGMMHPELFTMAGYPEGAYTGFAFGLGVERIVMQRYGITDIRDLYANDLRLLRQIIR